jgi:hypothetical protein
LVALYSRADEQVSGLPEEVRTVVRYPDLVAAPERVVTEIYGRLGWRLDERARAGLATELARARDFRSGHVYDLESFGLDADVVYRDLGFLFEKYGFTKTDASHVP